MKNIIHCLTLALAILVLVVSGCDQKVDIEAERAALRNADEEWSNVTGAKDVDGFVAAFAENGSILPPNTPILTGTEAIRQREMMANPGFTVGWQATTVEVSTAGDLGYIVGTYESTLQDVQGNPVTDRGKYVTVWKKQPDGKWKVVADIFNSDLPAPTAGLSESDETAIRQLLQELPAVADEAQKTEANVEAIKGWLLDEYFPAMKAGDVDGLRAFYSEDLIWLPPNEPVVQGIEACLDYVRPIFEQFNIQATYSVEEIKAAHSLGFARINYTHQFVPKAEGEPMQESGKLIYILERQPDGSWKITRVIWNPNSPPSQ